MRTLFVISALLVVLNQASASYLESTIISKNWNVACSQAKTQALRGVLKNCARSGLKVQVLQVHPCEGADGAYSVGVSYECN
jgi:hypothetical protein